MTTSVTSRAAQPHVGVCGTRLLIEHIEPLIHRDANLRAHRHWKDEGNAPHKVHSVQIISSSTPIISLACAHPSKFPDVIKKAINIKPQLPDHLKELMVSKEYFKVIGDDTKFIKNYLKEKMRS